MPLTLSGTTGVSGVDGTAATPAVRGGDADTGIVYGTNTVQIATNGAAAVTVDASQNVGVGTATPGQKLDVNGNVRSKSSTGGVFNLDSTTTGTANTIGSYANNGAAFADINYSGNQHIWLVAGSERARIDSSGNLLVGTTSTIAAANTKVSILQSSTDWALFLRNSGNSSVIGMTNGSGTATYTAVGFYNNGTSYSFTGAISVSGTSTTYATSSDYRMKENVQPMQDALATVSRLRPVTYTWKTDGAHGQGFIAHELQSVVPDCVIGEKDAVDDNGKPIYQGVDTSFLVATLTAAIQELSAKLDAAEARIAALEAK